MSVRKNPFTYVPDRNKILDGKRFSRRTTTVRPITFFKTWDSVSHTPDKSTKEKSLSRDSVYVPETQKEKDDRDSQIENREDAVILNETPMKPSEKESPIRNPILEKLAKELSPTCDAGYSGNRNLTSKQPDDVNDRTSTDKTHNGPESGKGGSGEMRTNSRVHTATSGRDSRVVNNSSVNRENLSRKEHKNVENENAEICSEGLSSEESVVNDLQSAGLYVTATNGSGIPESVNQKSQPGNTNSGDRNVQQKKKPNDNERKKLQSDKRKSGDTNIHRKRSISNQGEKLQPGNKNSRDTHIQQKRQNVNEMAHGESDDESNWDTVNESEVSVTDMEDIDITHKIPLAQSTAIGVDIEQDTEEISSIHPVKSTQNNSKQSSQSSSGQGSTSQGRKKQVDLRRELLEKRKSSSSSQNRRPGGKSNSNQSQNKENNNESREPHIVPRRSLRSTSIQAEKNQSHAQSTPSTPKAPAKRRLVTSTPKPEHSEKRKRTSADRAEHVQEVVVEIESVHKPSHLSAVSQAEPSTSKDQESVAVETPDLRKAMLLSYAKTPVGVTPSYLVNTPKSGPVIRPRKKRPQVVPVPADLSLASPQRVESVDLWQGDLETKRHLSDTTDLDIVLQTYEKLAWFYKENIEEKYVKKAVTLFAKKTQADLRSMVCKCQQMKNMKTSYSRGQSIIKKKRIELLNLQREYSRQKASLAEVKLELESIEAQAECQSDILQFQKQVQTAKKEQAAKKGKGKIIGCALTNDNTGLQGDALLQARKIWTRSLKSLKS